MSISPIVTAADIGGLGPIRLLYVPAGDERPAGLTCVPIADWIAHAKQSASGFDDLPYWQAALERLGVGSDATTVVVDDGGMTEAARVWFVLQYFGLPTAVLNGGLDRLGPVLPQAAPTTAPLTLTPGAGPVGLMDRARLKADLPGIAVFDTRTEAEFTGIDLKGNSRGGHLPGASNLPHDRLLGDGLLRPTAELAALLDAAGLDGARPIVSHCNGGGRGALAALAALVAGREDVSLYYLSFADWAADESCPIR